MYVCYVHTYIHTRMYVCMLCSMFCMLSSVSLLSYYDVHFGVERTCSFLFYTALPNETPACTHRFLYSHFV
jgi:hypothetical protein